MTAKALRRWMTSAFAAVLLALSWQGLAAEVRVMSSGAFTAALIEIVPHFERASGHKVLTAFGASMGSSPDSIPSRLDRGERVDAVILAAEALDQLIERGKLERGTRTDLVHSEIGLVVRAGAARPDISSVEALKRALVEAKAIGYSASASGVYVSTELFRKLGLHEQLTAKSKRVVGERVAAVVARGEAELGFQQVSELINVPGADFIGTLPAEVQRVTIFSAGLAKGSAEPSAARELIRYLASPASSPIIVKSGLVPAFPQR
jgi:molybdate transport system substrate-binding protein